ncbi:hypothetical protein [Lederbergia panacisoli]|uniref:hypothetical protein n=1 Tax=Lederbergia panacisoli TaxID=1255251 RepID=UPI00214C529F|nr:hypothetical protein [Lederbergia panacisoli]MCR2820053.1 hypothetical protein [Lederbergia panacisoli]
MLFFKGNSKNVWMNIDKPTKKCTIHTNCSYLDKKSETKYKGILELKRDGGWLKFDSKNEAKKYHLNNCGTYSLIEHC